MTVDEEFVILINQSPPEHTKEWVDRANQLAEDDTFRSKLGAICLESTDTPRVARGVELFILHLLSSVGCPDSTPEDTPDPDRKLN